MKSPGEGGKGWVGEGGGNIDKKTRRKEGEKTEESTDEV